MGAETMVGLTVGAALAGLTSAIAGGMGQGGAGDFSFTPPTTVVDNYTEDLKSDADIAAEEKRKSEELAALERQNALTGDAGVAEEDQEDIWKSRLV